MHGGLLLEYESGGGVVIGRREILMLAGAGLVARLRGAGADFWDTKPPEQWSEEEIGRLLTDSPWAKQVTVETVSETAPGSESGGSGQPAPEVPRTRGDNAKSAPGVGIPRGGARVGALPPPQQRVGPGATRTAVLWESARPVMDAVKKSLPGTFEDRYVISVRGSLLTRTRAAVDDAKLDILKPATVLQPNDKPEAHPDVLQGASSMGQVLLFGFSKQDLAIVPGDKEVLFRTTIGAFRIQARFNLQEMLYQGKLAL
jgi:hypothetical protein